MEVATILYVFKKVKKTERNFIEGEFPIKIRLAQVKEKTLIPLGYSSSYENWDEVYGVPKPSHPHFKQLTKKISNYLDDINFQLKLAEKERENISTIELKRKVTHAEDKTASKASQLKILEFLDKVITELEEAGNPGYADVFDSTRATVSKLLNNGVHIPPDEREKEKDKPFSAFTKEDHENYEKLISKNGASESTISFYLRNYFRIWNLAIKDGYVTREKHHPAKYIKFQPYKTIRTKKRAINRDYLRDILGLNFDPESRMYRSQQILKFIYYARGINFGDTLKLKSNNIANDTIHYTRSKNHRQYDFTLHPQALEVINYFKNRPEKSDDDHIFPFLSSTHDTPRKVDQRIESALKDFNEDLKVMAEAVGWERKFTSYSLRHSFATDLRNSGVSIGVIKEAMGHQLEKQTNVYMEDIDDKPISDEINRALDLTAKKDKNSKGKKHGRHL